MMNHMKTLLIHKKAGWMMLLASCLLFPYSCADEAIVEQEQIRPDDAIAFSVVDSDSWKSITTGAMDSRTISGCSRNFLGMMGKDSLFITMVEESIDFSLFSEKEDTCASRGKSYASTNFTSFKVKAILDDGAEFMNNTEMTKSSQNEEWSYSPKKYWPQNNAVHFLGYAKSKENGEMNLSLISSNGEGNASFTYTLPAPVNTGVNANKDAENQPDLIFSFLPNKKKQAVNTALQFNFQHALSAIVFKEGTMPASVMLEKVAFANVYSNASCAINGNGTFVWSGQKTPETYTQIFSNPADGEVNISTTDDETCFMMIPQEFGADKNQDAEIHITLKATSLDPIENKERSNSYTFTKKLSEFGNWDANKKYTFVISSSEEVAVEVSDKLYEDDSVKKDLVIRNTGLAPAYIRVGIVGTWVLPTVSGESESRLVVAHWSPKEEEGIYEGTFVWGDNVNFNANDFTPNTWYKHTDGYFYYLGLVGSGQEAPQLFKSYTLNATPPVAGAELDLVIMAQAVLPADVSLIWPTNIYAYLSSLNDIN